ncbi:hypothetical protein VNO77_08880 [Canavalia gladiata]|uniref:Uncharacterized protein n=1 Tax=Canavalia gladiata TaxID=3824 RepID=A0AAN9M9M4_CANGL
MLHTSVDDGVNDDDGVLRERRCSSRSDGGSFENDVESCESWLFCDHRVEATMAYRRKHGISRASTFKEEIHHRNSDENINNPPPPSLSSFYSFSPSSSSSSLAAQAIKASAARHHDPSLLFTFNKSGEDRHKSKSFDAYGGVSNSKPGFWGVLAQKAKEILEDDNSSPHSNDTMPQNLRSHSFNTFSPSARPQYACSLPSFLDGRIVEENKTTGLKTPIKPKGSSPKDSNQASGMWNPWQQSTHTPNSQPINETQLKASRDVAMATAAKAKLLLRELKTVKADLAFSKARCAQLEEENKLLRDCEGRQKGQNRADDDLIRLQLETLLAEKARLANENELYARENRFLREIVEYHQLTTQDMVYLDEGMDEVTELYPIETTGNTVPRMISMSPRSPFGARATQTKTIFPVPLEEEDDEEEVEENNASKDKAPSIISVSISKN